MRDERPRFVLDTFALLAYLQQEPGYQQVKDILIRAKRGEAEVFLSIVSYGEALYILERQQGIAQVPHVIGVIDQLPLQVLNADRSLAFAAAHVKANHSISYADAFVVALGQQTGAVVVTGDPEFHAVEHLITMEWLPQP